MTLSKNLRAALALCVLAAPAVLHAQDYTKYDTVNNPKRYGTIWAPFYQKANELTAQTRKDFPHHLDISFGESPKQALDVYLPKKPVKNAPVLLFLHGGGFMEGDRAHYGYVARPYVEKGIVTVVSGYRMAKRGVPYPAQSDDTKAAIVWIHKNIAQFGGDPNKIFLSGHSVGATLSADVSFDRGWMKQAGVPRDAIKGIALISGDYDLSPGENADYAPTAELEERASPDRHLVDPAPVAVVAAGTNEGKMRASAEEIEQRLIAKGVKGNLLILEGADHKDTVLAFGEPDSTLSAAVLEMIGRK
jgi:acetyl esterase/lipase